MLGFYLAMLDSEDDKQKFTELYQTYRPAMYAVAYEILKDTHWAEDVVHDAFLKIIKILHKISRINCPPTYSLCVTISRNTAYNFHRDHKLSNPPEVYEDLEYILSDDSRIEDEFLEKEDKKRLIQAILDLPDNYRDVILLYYSNEYELADIAKILGISQENAKKRWQRGKKKLVKMLREEDIADGGQRYFSYADQDWRLCRGS